jgi:hypothetical protein
MQHGWSLPASGGPLLDDDENRLFGAEKASGGSAAFPSKPVPPRPKRLL